MNRVTELEVAMVQVVGDLSHYQVFLLGRLMEIHHHRGVLVSEVKKLREQIHTEDLHQSVIYQSAKFRMLNSLETFNQRRDDLLEAGIPPRVIHDFVNMLSQREGTPESEIRMFILRS